MNPSKAFQTAQAKAALAGAVLEQRPCGRFTVQIGRRALLVQDLPDALRYIGHLAELRAMRKEAGHASH